MAFSYFHISELKDIRGNFVDFMRSTVTKDIQIMRKKRSNLDDRIGGAL